MRPLNQLPPDPAHPTGPLPLRPLPGAGQFVPAGEVPMMMESRMKRRLAIAFFLFLISYFVIVISIITITIITIIFFPI